MADELLEKARDVFEGQIDFDGQRLAELLTTALLTTAGIVAFLTGYFTQDIALTLWIGLAGAVLTFVVVVPPWPFFNKNPVTWLPALQGGTGGVDIQVEVDGQTAT
ncbi:SPC12-domain-containing protein [Saccharata proteae CBS 121410]|uniref:Signal peptidase complex subunit 1 n=1 Tax=Saccharata proteae CBS 121410 TaxID=1314787 RepID=A0A9P4HT74_9PEZI|nr:SPC12-domain-containing protein [Saccharata proteae CBS 121410]